MIWVVLLYVRDLIEDFVSVCLVLLLMCGILFSAIHKKQSGSALNRFSELRSQLENANGARGMSIPQTNRLSFFNRETRTWFPTLSRSCHKEWQHWGWALGRGINVVVLRIRAVIARRYDGRTAPPRWRIRKLILLEWWSLYAISLVLSFWGYWFPMSAPGFWRVGCKSLFSVCVRDRLNWFRLCVGRSGWERWRKVVLAFTALWELPGHKRFIRWNWRPVSTIVYGFGTNLDWWLSWADMPLSFIR